MGRAFSQDLSSFMCIILMLIGVLVIMLISNVMTIISNPENIRITSLFQAGDYAGSGGGSGESTSPFPYGNKAKEPSYIDVHRNRVVVYPGAEVVSLQDLETPGNAFEGLLAAVEENKENDYIILLARPGTALIINRLKKVIRDRGIDLGFELYEADRVVEYDRAAKASGKAAKD